MNIAQLSIEKKTITIVITTLLLFGGIKSYMGLGRLEDPEFTIKSAKVITYYPGATAMEVAEEVTDPLEISIQKMGQVRRVKSLSMPGFSSIEVEIKKVCIVVVCKKGIGIGNERIDRRHCEHTLGVDPVVDAVDKSGA